MKSRTSRADVRCRVRPPLRGAILAAVLGAAGACLDLDVDENRDTAILLVATPPTAVVGQEVSFQVEAEGTELFGVLVDFQDGVVDTTYAFGSTKIALDVRHAFTTAADHEVVAEVFETSGRTLADTVVVPVSDPSGG